MIAFVSALIALIVIVVIYQLITKMKIVGGNELGIVSGTGRIKGFRSISGGRVFIIPLLHRFAKLNLTPHTIEVVVETAIASGVVPLNVKATVSFAIASNEAGRSRAATRILSLSEDQDNLRKTAADIIEGHLRDSIASMTPEQVMKDKDALVAKMINVCKEDLENIGLEITTMNIADVDDHRLEGVDEPDLYIALLKRVQTTNAESKARQAQANAHAAATEQEQSRRAETEVRALENEHQRLVADTRVRAQEENQRKTVGVEQESRNAAARVAGLKAEIEAEKQLIEMLSKKFEANLITPAQAERERYILEAQADVARIRAKAQAEIDQLRETFSIIKNDKAGEQTYIVENFERLIAPFAETLKFFPVDRLSVITGVEGQHGPISAIHPNAIDMEKNRLIGGAIAEVLQRETGKPQRSASKPQGSEETSQAEAAETESSATDSKES